MFWKIFLFEVRYRFKRPATYAYFFVLFLFAFVSGIYGNSPASEKVYVNSAYAIGYFMIILSVFETLIASAVMGVPVYRDIEYRTKDYFFTYPITEKSYLLGRFLGSFVILIFISFGFHVRYFWLSGELVLLVFLFKVCTDVPAFLGSIVFVEYAYVVVYKYTAANP